jgi:hypothetical protein
MFPGGWSRLRIARTDSGGAGSCSRWCIPGTGRLLRALGPLVLGRLGSWGGAGEEVCAGINQRAYQL